MVTAPRVLTVSGSANDAASAAALAEAAQILRGGGLVAFPTETVYGLGADATNPQAIERLNRVKGRPPEKPYSLHIYTPEQLRPFVTSIPESAARLMARFWPGPLTIVLPAAGGRTVGFRLPDHPVARAFLKACAVPVAAPSANRSGEPPAQSLDDLKGLFGDQVDLLLEGGDIERNCKPSTVVDLTRDPPSIVRAGRWAGRVEEFLSRQ